MTKGWYHRPARPLLEGLVSGGRTVPEKGKLFRLGNFRHLPEWAALGRACRTSKPLRKAVKGEAL